MIEALLVALLTLVPPVPQPKRGWIERHHARIVARATEASERYGVPPALLLTVGFLEAHLGADGPGWGAPIDARHRMRDGTPATAASSLAWGFRVCHTWVQATSFFRSGRCHSPHLIGYQPATAVRLAERMMARAGVALPESWR